MCEDAARTVHLARALGELTPLISQEQVDALHRRYTARVRPALTGRGRAHPRRRNRNK